MPVNPDTQRLTTGLEALFKRIHRERMTDMPMLNPALKVQAISFAPWNDKYLGVLVTPWFMNLMLLPHEGDDWADLHVGESVSHAFPSGIYDFVVGIEEDIGRYQSCSLFSPVFEFDSQETAVAVAEAVLDALWNKDNQDDSGRPREQEMQDIWAGKQLKPDPGEQGLFTPPAPEKPAKTLSERMDEPMSRRELLRGNFLREPPSQQPATAESGQKPK